MPLYLPPATIFTPVRPLITSPAIGTTETIVLSIPVPANFLTAGTAYFFKAHGTSQGTVTPTMTVRVAFGVNNTIADADIAASTALAVPTAGTAWVAEIYVTCRTVGAAGTLIANMNVMYAGTATAPLFYRSNNLAPGITVNTTVANFLTFTLQGGGTTPVITPNIAFAQLMKV